jgi:TRAP-type C4-dicarboxylate transport system substrate-binding protein
MAAASILPALTIKLASLVPPGSPWEEQLKKLSIEWAEISNKKVILKIYSGGIAGGEDDMIRKMRLGQLHAAALTGPGLSQIFGGVLAIQIPLLAENEKELFRLLEVMGPVFAGEMEKRGFKLLFWEMLGWAYLYSRHPVDHPEDLKKQKMWVMAGNEEEANAWKKMDFQVFVLPTSDMMVQLQSGGIDAFFTSPLIAASNQWFGFAKNMSSLRFAPFIGGIIVSTRTWDRIPKEFQPLLEESAMKISGQMRALTQGANDMAISAMQKYGLVINETTDMAKEAWKETIAEGLMDLIGNKFDIKYYEEAKQIVEDFRKENVR